MRSMAARSRGRSFGSNEALAMTTAAPSPSAQPVPPWHSLEGKTIWITGGTGHLGAPITTALDASCAKVVCIDLPGRAEAFITQHRLQRTLPAAVDLCDVERVRAGVAQLIDAHGVPDGVAHLVFASSSGSTLEDLPAETFAATLTRALPPTFEFCRALAERMKPRGRGAFVLFASMYGVVVPDPRIYIDQLTPNPIDYGANKAALLQMMRYFAMHYGPSGIRFNCVTPGPFPNPRVQANNPRFIEQLGKKTILQRIGQNHEIVGPTLFLLTDSASFVTGHSLMVDGGWTTW